MGFFRKKGKYWYFVIIRAGKQVQYYIGKDEKVLAKLVPKTR